MRNRDKKNLRIALIGILFFFLVATIVILFYVHRDTRKELGDRIEKPKVVKITDGTGKPKPPDGGDG